MKLYYSPGACSLSPHIALREAGLKFDLVRVDLATKKTEAGDDFRAVNPNGYVPVLILDDGMVLMEGPAIVQYVADQAPGKHLAPENGTLPRYRLQSLLNFISTELHKSFTPLFNPAASEDWKQSAREVIAERLTYLQGQMAGPYLLGEQFSVADGYLFTVLGWCKYVNFDLSPWPRLGEYLGRIAARPAVLEALKAEGLVK
jgi:glutathione S-transferase